MNGSWLVRAAAAGTAGILAAGVAVSWAAAETEASWLHPQAAQASVAAAVVPAPAGVNCASSDSALGGPVATVRWSAPASVNGSTTTYVVAGKRNAGDAEWTKISDASGNSYAFGNGLLGGLVGSILNLLFGSGSEITVGVIALHTFSGGAVWESVPGQTVKVSKAQGGALGLLDGFKCG